jgi:hypothetical protein
MGVPKPLTLNPVPNHDGGGGEGRLCGGCLDAQKLVTLENPAHRLARRRQLGAFAGRSCLAPSRVARSSFRVAGSEFMC